MGKEKDEDGMAMEEDAYDVDEPTLFCNVQMLRWLPHTLACPFHVVLDETICGKARDKIQGDFVDGTFLLDLLRYPSMSS